MFRRRALAIACLLPLAVACTSRSGPAATTTTAPTGGISAGSMTATASSAAAGGPADYRAKVDFAACDPGWNPQVDLSAFRCATTTVPLDWSQPTGKTIQLAVVQHPATDQANKIGTLFFNPGGPGGTATGQFTLWYPYFPEELRQRFDMVSWDPRGVGLSDPVQCWDTQEQQAAATAAIADYPTTTEQQAAYRAAMTAIGQQCARRDGEKIRHVSTTDTAKDLEALRLALGGQPLNYIGVSYGTFLGATYANLFPDSIRAMTLDGNLDPDNWFGTGGPVATSINTRIGSDRGISENMAAFLRLCGQSSTDACAFSAGSPEATARKWQDMLADLAANPLTTASGEVFDDQLLAGNAANGLDIVSPVAETDSAGWSGLAKGLQTLWTQAQARTSGAASPSAASSASSPTPAPSSSGTSEAATSAAADSFTPPYSGPEGAWSIMCSDTAVPPSSAWPGLGEQTLAAYGEASAGLVWGDMICLDWPGRATGGYAGPWDTPTSAPILLIGNTDDPSTPLPNTVGMGSRLARTATVTVQGYGHTMLLNPSSCGAGHEVAYFIDGTLPADGTVCQQDRAPFRP